MVIGFGDVSLHVFFYPKIFTRGVHYIYKMPKYTK